MISFILVDNELNGWFYRYILLFVLHTITAIYLIFTKKNILCEFVFSTVCMAQFALVGHAHLVLIVLLY